MMTAPITRLILQWREQAEELETLAAKASGVEREQLWAGAQMLHRCIYDLWTMVSSEFVELSTLFVEETPGAPSSSPTQPDSNKASSSSSNDDPEAPGALIEAIKLL